MSINEIKNYTFQAQRGGNYKSSEVDEVFSQIKETLDALAGAYEKAKRENEELYRKITSLSDKIEEYKKDEDSIHSALVTAQRMADQIVRDAKEQSAALVDAAQAKADEVIGSIKGETDSYVKENRESADAYLEQAKTVYEEKMAEVKEKADGIIEKAKMEAERVISDAEMKSDEIIAKANIQSDEITSNANAKIENAKKKLADLMTLTAEYKAGVVDVLNKQIALFDSINVDSHEYAAEYYPQSFHIDSNDVYRPELTVEDYTLEIEEPVIAEAETETEAEVEESKTEEKPNEEVEENISEEITSSNIQVEEEFEIEEIEVEETPIEEVEEVEEIEKVQTEEVAVDNTEAEISVETESIDETETTEKTETETFSQNDTPNAEEIDYYETLIKKLAEETKSAPAEPIEARNNNSIFTAYDLADGLDDDEEEARVNLRTVDDDEDEQLEFGKEFDIFNDDDDSQTSFFGRFKKK